MRKLLIFGTGGLARELSAWCGGAFEIVAYASADREEHAAFGLPRPVFEPGVTPEQAGTDLALIAIGSPADRERNFEALKQAGFSFPVFVHPSAVVVDSARLDEGCVVAPLCLVGPQVQLGKAVYLNFCVGVGHDAQVGDFSQINPGAQIGGDARIGRGCLVGSGATILQKVSVHAGATIGSGSVCFSAVAEGVTVMGNPARRLRAFEDG